MGWSKRARAIGATIAGFVAAYAALLYGGDAIGRTRVLDHLHDWWWRGLGEWPSGTPIHRVIDLLGHATAGFVRDGSAFVLAVATGLVTLGFLARTTARARVRAGLADPLDAVRRFVAGHPWWVRAITAGPSLVIAAVIASGNAWWHWGEDNGENLGFVGAWGIVALLGGVAITGLARAGVRWLIAPTFDPSETQPADVDEREITFDAVAVTRETIAALVAMSALTVAAVALPWATRAAPAWIEIAYVIVALGGAATFRLASRIAVGVDGVLVKGTSRRRFFAYRDLDGARVRGGDVELLRRDRVVLRLQLHGEDAARRDAIVARIVASIERVKDGGDARAARLVASASTEQLARVASGSGDYRTASLTRDELWALVEGPAVDAATRAAAAAALIETGGDAQRARLRVVASTCAEPQVRVALAQLVEADAGDGEPAAAGARVR